MNDVEKLQNATNMIECLANGIHPITGEILEGTVFDEPEIIRCLFFVKEVLREHIAHPPKMKKGDFSIPETLRLEDFLQDQPISLTPFIKKIKEANHDVGPNANKIWELLLERGLLYKGENINGKETKLPTELGEQSGLKCVTRHNSAGVSYYVVVYDRKGQELLLDCIRELYS